MPQTVAVPDNVPRELVVDFDFYSLAGKAEDIQLAWAELHKGPDIVWTPHYGGYWIATRAADIQVMQVDYAHFSHHELDIPLNPARVKPIRSEERRVGQEGGRSCRY